MKHIATWILGALGLGGMTTFGMSGRLPGVTGGNQSPFNPLELGRQSTVDALQKIAWQRMSVGDIAGAEGLIDEAAPHLAEMNPHAAGDEKYFARQVWLKQQIANRK
jgi:hypothetical protein